MAGNSRAKRSRAAEPVDAGLGGHEAEAVQASDDQAPAARALVRMVRRADQYPAPHAADVHPAEIENYKAGGWTVAD